MRWTRRRRRVAGLEAKNVVEEKVLKVKRREGTGSRASAAIRQTGAIPGIVYGKDEPNVNVEVNLQALMPLVEGGVHTLDLDIEGDRKSVIIKEIQHGTFHHEILHADFRVITADTLVTVDVPLGLVGTAPAIEEGGLVSQEFWQITVECKPADIPETFELDISGVNVGDTLYVSDLTIPEGVSVQMEEDTAIVTSQMPAGELELEEEAEAEAAEPELIGEKPEEEGEGEGEEGAS